MQVVEHLRFCVLARVPRPPEARWHLLAVTHSTSVVTIDLRAVKVSGKTFGGGKGNGKGLRVERATRLVLPGARRFVQCRPQVWRLFPLDPRHFATTTLTLLG